MRKDDSLEKSLMLGKIEGRRRDRIIDMMNMNLGKLWEMVRDMEAWSAAVLWVAKGQTRLSDRTTALL